MSDKELKAERARGYSQGYAAGQRRKASTAAADKRRREELAFWDRVFLSVAPYFVGCEAWTRGDRKLSSMDDRTELAAKFASQALKHRRHVS